MTVQSEAAAVRVDRRGNVLAEALPYARGQILRDTNRDLQKLTKAWHLINTKIQAHGTDAVYNFTGLERKIVPASGTPDPLDDEISPALYYEALRTAALTHLGGNDEDHDIAVFNRMAAATLATHLALVRPGNVVIGVSPSYSHATILRAARLAGARFLDVVGADAFGAVLQQEPQVALVVLTRMAVTYDILSLEAMRNIIHLAQRRDIPVYIDDAGGARVGPVVLQQPKMLELGVDLGATGLDKYGCYGPRMGLLAGAKEWVAQVRAKGFELGLEARPMLYGPILRSLQAYDPVRVRTLVATTKQVARELRRKLGARVTENEVTAQLLAEDILELAMERARIISTSLLPYEASAALAMLLLRDYGIITVHFAGLPPGTGALLLKFIPPETLTRFGGAARLVEAIDTSLDELAQIIGDPQAVENLLLN